MPDINRTGRAHTDLLSLMVGQGYSDHGPTVLEIRNAVTALYYSAQNLLSSWLLSTNLKIKIYRTIILPVVLYGCETWSLTLRVERRLRVLENRVLRVFGPKGRRKVAVVTIQGLGSCLFTVLPNQQSSVRNNEGLNDL